MPTNQEDDPVLQKMKTIFYVFLYRREDRIIYQLRSHFDKKENGFCTLCPEEKQPGTLEHMLLNCRALEQVRLQQFEMINSEQFSDLAKQIICDSLKSFTQIAVQLLLDCSVLQIVIRTAETNKNITNEIFKFTRTWCFNLHAKRLKLQGRWRKSS